MHESSLNTKPLWHCTHQSPWNATLPPPSLHSSVITISKINDLSPINPPEMRYFGDLAFSSPVETRHFSEIASKNARRRGHFTYLAVGHDFAARSSDNMHSLMHTKRSVLAELYSPILFDRDNFMILHSENPVKCNTSVILHRWVVEKTSTLEISSSWMAAKCDSLVTCIGQSLYSMTSWWYHMWTSLRSATLHETSCMAAYFQNATSMSSQMFFTMFGFTNA